MLLKDYKYLLDENISDKVLAFFQRRGIDATSIAELKMQSTPNEEIIPFAEAENRIIITQDHYFASSIVRFGIQQIGVIFIRPGNVHSDWMIATLESLLDGEMDVKVPFVLVVTHTEKAVKVRLRQL